MPMRYVVPAWATVGVQVKSPFVGLMAALERWAAADHEAERRRMTELGDCLERGLAGVDGVTVVRSGVTVKEIA